MNLDVIILGAGKGSRMNSSKAKVLHSLGEKALISHVVDSYIISNNDLLNLDNSQTIYSFSEDEIMIQHSVREFVDNEVIPIIDEHFKNATFPNDLISQFAAMN